MSRRSTQGLTYETVSVDRLRSDTLLREELLPLGNQPRGVMRWQLESLIPEPQTKAFAVIAREHGCVVGWALTIEEPSVARVYSMGVFVLDTHRLRGIGTELVARTVAADADGKFRYSGLTVQRSEAARRLFARFHGLYPGHF